MKLFADQYRGRKVLLTGHTGFKGSWLALWLNELGAQVTGIALSPETNPNHWDLLGLNVSDHRCDVRDESAILQILTDDQPEIVFHLAAQPLVRRSYRDPLQTWSTNVMGTANILDACRKAPSIRAIVVVTSDKCYENQEWVWGYRETDRLGGHDPYSASKAATEIVVASYRDSYFQGNEAPLLASVRAGNVIGGGDWSEDRLIPDLVRAISQNSPLEIRSPNATRPWQHVLESLSGYLLLGQQLLENRREFAEGWNFGPDVEGNRTVVEVLTQLRAHWTDLSWRISAQPHPHEANLLYLDSAKAKDRLGWKPVWSLSDTVKATADWYREYLEHGSVNSKAQLVKYIDSAQAAEVVWSGA